MKERLYTKVPEVAHCPKCHRPIKVPSFLKQAKIQGEIRLGCCCKKGVAVIKPQNVPQEETVNG